MTRLTGDRSFQLSDAADEYGRAVSLQANAVAYELTNGGDAVRGKPEMWPDLERLVNEELERFRDRISPGEVRYQLKTWLHWNEKKFEGAMKEATQ